MVRIPKRDNRDDLRNPTADNRKQECGGCDSEFNLKFRKMLRPYENLGVNLCQVLVSLIQEMAEHCKTQNVDVSAISAFDASDKEWSSELLKIYEGIFV